MNIGELIYAFFTHTGPGGVVVLVVIATAGTIYYMLIRWILQGAEEEPLTIQEARTHRREERQRRWAERRRRGPLGD